MAVNIPLSHQAVKAPGQRVFAVADWNADHQITADVNLGAYNLTTTGTGTFGSIGNHLIPTTHDTYDLGANGTEWRNLWVKGGGHIDFLYVDTHVNTNLIPLTNNSYDLGSISKGWRNLFVSDDAVIGDDLNVGGGLFFVDDSANAVIIGAVIAISGRKFTVKGNGADMQIIQGDGKHSATILSASDGRGIIRLYDDTVGDASGDAEVLFDTQGYDSFVMADCGFGTKSPVEDVHAADTVRADVFFNINGTDGSAGNFTTVDGKTVTVVGGIITAIV